jgi:DNA-binding response OmpR family regulator
MKTARILLVENSSLLATLLPLQLTKHGYQVVRVVKTGEEAVETAANTPLDIVLMDIDLDGEMDGIAAATALQKIQNVPLVFTTSHSDLEIQKRIQANGPAISLLKPFTEKELTLAIQFALYQHAAEREKQRLEQEVRRLTQLLTNKAVESGKET